MIKPEENNIHNKNDTNKSKKFLVLVVMFSVIFSSVATGGIMLSFSESLGFGAERDIKVIKQPYNPVSSVSSHIKTSSGSTYNLTQLYNSVRYSVVSIYTSYNDNTKDSQGSGYFYNKKYVVTNQHVVGKSKSVKLQYGEHQWLNGTVIGTDKYSDLAVIKVTEDVPDKIKPIPLSDDLPPVGSKVVAIGSPFNLQNSLSHGIVSGLHRSLPSRKSNYIIPDMIQTDASLNPGNSGGPLINMDGEVVGIDRAKQGSGIGFAVSSRIVQAVVPKLITDGEYNYPYLGVRTIEVNPEIAKDLKNVSAYEGLLVVGTESGTPADKVLKATEIDEKKLNNAEGGNINMSGGDVLIGIGGKNVKDNEDIASILIRKYSPGDKVPLKIIRNGDVKTVYVEASQRD